MGAETGFRTAGQMPALSADALAHMKEHLTEWALPVTEEPGRLSIAISGGEVVLHTEPGRARLEIFAAGETLLRDLQDMLTGFFVEHGLEIDWSDVARGALAPGLALMRVVSVSQRTPGFLRVRLAGPEAARFAGGGLHFRLLLPPAGRVPAWPRVGPTGRVVWPTGEDTIHNPIYTTAIQQNDWLEFDIFRHERSPTCDWAANDPVGQEVAIVGPGGGLCPEGEPLLLFGDETALPAIARMLALARGEVRAHVSAARCDLGELARDPRVHAASDLLLALGDTAIPSGSHVWFAAGAQTARAARKHLLARGLGKRDFTAATYWV